MNLELGELILSEEDVEALIGKQIALHLLVTYDYVTLALLTKSVRA